MPMVINIRGTSGSGKTTVVRGIMAKGSVSLLGENLKKPEAYFVALPVGSLYVIGSYENVCGGCDSIHTQDEICNRVRKYAPLGHVMLEGLLMSHTFGRYAALDRELRLIPCIWAFLDTPLQVCLDRVSARREERRLAKKDPPPFKPLNPTNTTSAWEANRKTYRRFVENKYDARMLDHTNATEIVYSWLS